MQESEEVKKRNWYWSCSHRPSSYNGKVSYSFWCKKVCNTTNLILDSCSKTFTDKQEGYQWIEAVKIGLIPVVWASEKIGVVYCVQASNATSRIGKSRKGDCLNGRIERHYGGSPLTYDCLGIIECANANLVESKMHRILEHLKTKPSWYNATIEKVEELTGCLFERITHETVPLNYAPPSSGL